MHLLTVSRTWFVILSFPLQVEQICLGIFRLPKPPLDGFIVEVPPVRTPEKVAVIFY